MLPRWDDAKTGLLMGNLLRLGVLTAAAVVLVAGIFYLFQNHAHVVQYVNFQGEPPHLRSIRGIVGGLGALESRTWIQFGLLLLIATPILRVAFAVVAFALERDRMYVVVSLIVLAVLLYSILHAA